MLKHSELHRDVRLQAAGAGNLTQGCRHWLALSSLVGTKAFLSGGTTQSFNRGFGQLLARPLNGILPERRPRSNGMTALKKFEKIESSGIWRADAMAQRRDVIVTLGDATLTLLDMQERVLAHWSIPAVARANPGEFPAIFHPDGDPEETLELADDSELMIEAIEELRKAVERRRPRPGRLRLTSAILMMAGIAAVAFFWLPSAVRQQTLTALPKVKQQQIGLQIIAAAARFTGKACRAAGPDMALARLSSRLFAEQPSSIVIVPSGLTDAVALPGNHYLVGRNLVEDFETPEVLAGYLLAADLRSGGPEETIRDLVASASFSETLKLLTTGSLPQSAADHYAEAVLSQDRLNVIDPAIIPAFAAAGVSARPYAYAVDVTGETTLHLIEADPTAGQTPNALLSDSAWVELQGICET